MTSRPTSTQQRQAQAVDRIAPGDVLQGKFRVERIIGRGGMGVVIEATNIQLDQRVALKLLATGADDPAIVERFSREARAAARLKSEHVARVYDVGKDTLHGPFIVMEMLEGKTLAEAITTSGPMELHRAAECLIDACEGLAEAHTRGIIHQDVKPANLFLVVGSDGRPSVKLLDFGIATMRSKEQLSMDESSSSKRHLSAGTPAYLAPEQIRGSPPVDHRTDIWALGCVLFELLTGERAFKATRFTELVTKILEAPRADIHPALDIPIEIVAVIDRCLEKDLNKRFKTTAELALALLPFGRRRAHAVVERAVALVKAAGLDSHLEMPSSMPPRPPSSSDVAAAAAAVETSISSGQLRPPNVPRFSDQPFLREQQQQQNAPTQSGSHSPTASTTTTTSEPSTKNRGLGIAILALLVVVVLVGGMVGMRVLDRPTVTTTTTTPLLTTTATPTTPPTETAPSATTTVVASVSVAAITAQPSASASSSAPLPANEAWRTRPFNPGLITSRPRGSSSAAGATPPPANSESEIRHNR